MYALQSAMEFTRKRKLDDGGYDCSFSDEPPSDLICQICTCVARDPQQVSCCGKLYCNGCLKKHKEHSSTCPNCRCVRTWKSFPDIRSDRQIKQLKVSCKNEGCSWGGLLKENGDHSSVCGFAIVSCPNNCPQTVQRQNIQKHIENDCPQRVYTCPFCEESGPFQKMTTSHLEDKCPEMKVPCPNGCKEKEILRKDLKLHCDQCPKEVVACSFKEFGCPAELMRQQMVLHEKRSTQDHLQVVTTAASELKRKVSTLEERLSTLERQVRKPVKVCKIEGYAALKATKDEWSTSFMAGEYKLKLYVGPEGDHLSIGVTTKSFIISLSTIGQITFELLNQVRNEKHYQITSRVGERRGCSILTRRIVSIPNFISHQRLESLEDSDCQYLLNDTLYIAITHVELSCDESRPWLT